MVWKPIWLTDFKMLQLKTRTKYLFAKMYFLGVILKKFIPPSFWLLFDQKIAFLGFIGILKCCWTRPLGALAIIYEFDQHNDTYFQYLGCKGSSEPLTVKSENSDLWRNWYTGCPKIRSRKYLNDFLTLKMWPLCLTLTKIQNLHLLSLF